MSLSCHILFKYYFYWCRLCLKFAENDIYHYFWNCLDGLLAMKRINYLTTMGLSMPMRTFLLVCFYLFLPCILWGKSDNNAVYFRCYFDKLNLPQTSILKIVQDDRGYLWLATGRGVYRFDGNEVVALADILPDNRDELRGYIPWVMIDGYKNLWLSNGYIYELTTGNLVRNTIMEKSMFNAPIVDKLGNYWFNYPDKFVRYDRDEKQCSQVEASVGFGFTQSEHYVWGRSTDGWLYRMSIGEGDIAVLKYDLSKWNIGEISVMLAVNDETVLIGAKTSGLWRYDLRTQTARQIFYENYVRDILRYSQSVCWVATENGIYIYNVNTDEIEHWKKDPHDVFAIQDHAIYSFYKDREGGVWCGSYFRGLSYVPNSQCKFNSFKPSKKYPGLEGTVVREFCKDSGENLWIGTEDNGLNCYNISDGSFANYSKNDGLGTNNIHGLCLDGRELWCGSFDNGIEVFDIDKRQVIRSFKVEDGRTNLKSNFVLSVMKSDDGTIWIGTGAGVQKYDAKEDRFDDLYEGIAPCSQLYQDSEGNIWCVCLSELACISVDGTLEKYRLNSGSIQSVMETRSHEIWVATSSGIARLDKSKACFVNHVLSDQNASTNYAYRIMEDGQGFFWISTAYGLVRFHPASQSSYVFTTLEGLPENRFNVSSSFQDVNGILYFGTINGFTSFDPTLLLPSKIVPKPAVTKLICTGVNLERTIFNIDNTAFEIDHTENNVTFEFSSFTYTAPDALRYRYRLEPLDKGWHVQQGCTPFTYPSLSSGNYTLRIQTTDYNGEWANNEVVYKIDILPPFYASWWAKLLYGCMLTVGILFLLWRWHNQMKKKQQIHIQEVKDATEKELYHTKINFFTTIVHEIRTPLTLIKAPLDKELESHRSENLLLVEKNVDRLQNLCTQLLDFRKMESEQLQLNFVKTNLPDLLKTILYRFSAQIKQNELMCEHNFDQVTLEAPVDREAFTKIVSNLLNNAVKYATHIIKIELGSAGDNFYLSVCNDGPPIEGTDRSKIFNMFYRTDDVKEKSGTGIGLAFCRSLAEMHNGHLDLVDDTAYTHFKLTLPMTQQLVFSIEAVSDDSEILDTADTLVSENSDTVVLIVEDEPELRSFLKKSLSEQYQVLVAGNGLQALEIIGKTSVSIVVTDVMMPKMDGCELCRSLKNNVELSGIPVVMLTAKNNVEAKLEGYMAGAEEYIEKPFSMKYLSARIAAIVGKKKKEAEIHFNSQPSVRIDNLAGKSDKALVERFRKLVEENLTSDKLNISFLCEQLGVSQTTFFRKLKSVMDISPNDYIRMARVERAASILLEVEDVRISDVAYELGFSSPSYFTRCFIQHFGMSPKDYVNRKKSEDDSAQMVKSES